MKKVGVCFLVFLVFTVSAILFSGVPAKSAEKPIELRLAHQYPVGSFMDQAMSAWAKKIADDSKGRLTIRMFPNNTLVPPPELYNAVVSGTADISFGSRYNPMGFTLGVTFPFILGAPNETIASKVYDDIWKQFPKVMADEWKDVKIVFLSAQGPQVLFTKKAVRALEDVKGLQIRTGGKEGGDLLKDLGATPVFMSSGDLVVAIEKGTVDGAGMHPSGIRDFKLGGKIKYIMMDVNLGAPVPIMCIMNKDSYNKLPADLKAVIDNSAEFGKQKVLDGWRNTTEDDMKYWKAEGIEIIHFSPQELARWQPTIDRARDRVGKELDTKGIPGTEVVKYIRERVASYSKK
jgi:TRAP-type transport system periplasmic protein